MSKMDPKHEAKVDELIEKMAEELKKVCVRLHNSGGVDFEKFDLDEYVLAKILVTAAMHECKDNLRPLSYSHRADLKNLQHF